MDVIMPTAVPEHPYNARWGEEGIDWVWDHQETPLEWGKDWDLLSDWAWEDEETGEDWGKEGEDWEWYEGEYDVDEE